VKEVIFVVKAILVLIFEKVFDQEEDYYEGYKRNQDLYNTSVVFFMQFFVLSIGENDDNDKGNEEKCGKNELSRTEHIFIFAQI
jgi:hypothetical protein